MLVELLILPNTFIILSVIDHQPST